MRASDRVIRWTTARAVIGVAAVASYEHAYSLVRAHGEAGWTRRLVPLTVDGLIYACSMVMLDSARQKVPSVRAIRARCMWVCACPAGTHRRRGNRSRGRDSPDGRAMGVEIARLRLATRALRCHLDELPIDYRLDVPGGHLGDRRMPRHRPRTRPWFDVNSRLLSASGPKLGDELCPWGLEPPCVRGSSSPKSPWLLTTEFALDVSAA